MITKGLLRQDGLFGPENKDTDPGEMAGACGTCLGTVSSILNFGIQHLPSAVGEKRALYQRHHGFFFYHGLKLFFELVPW